jgi:thiol-disulfide isomerase/thioredoxin
MTLLPALIALAQAPALDLTLMPSDLFERIHGYMPYGLKLSNVKPENLTKAPSATAPKYGTIKIGDRLFTVLLDGADKLYVDSNGNGDLTDDPATKWTLKKFANGNESWQGEASVELSYGGKATPVAIGLYSTGQPDDLGYYMDFALTGKAKLGGKSYDVIYNDPTGAFDGKSGILLIDKDGNGSFHPGFEFYRVTEPFNIAGVTYEMSGLGLKVSTKKVPERTLANSAPADPNLANGLRPGKAALTFSATTMSGRKIAFPKSYAGKIVMIDFWATWCGPCMREVPGLAKAYAKYKGKGFELLGISLDRTNAEEQIRTVTLKNGMTWEQVYDGNYFDAKIAKQYGIKAIPATYLVDGDTGRILAQGDDLRGAKLEATLERALAAKKK